MSTYRIECDCASDYQDEKYGKGVRVHNGILAQGTVKKGTETECRSARCTVCGKEKPITK